MFEAQPILITEVPAGPVAEPSAHHETPGGKRQFNGVSVVLPALMGALSTHRCLSAVCVKPKAMNQCKIFAIPVLDSKCLCRWENVTTKDFGFPLKFSRDLRHDRDGGEI
jgi:hypothetical protein